MVQTNHDACWVFGYGSLIWKPGFEVAERYVGRLTGWRRRFWQGSVDHRGVPEAPGRVVTLLEAPDDETWGVALRVGARDRDRVMAQLDHRESGGYRRFDARVHLRAAPMPSVVATVYIATPENENFLGPAPLEAIAEQVRRSVGPSGPNPEYVLELDRALRELGVEDPHVAGIARLLEIGGRR